MKQKYDIKIIGKNGFENYYQVEECIVNPIREMIKNKHNIKEVEIHYKKLLKEEKKR